MKAPRVLLVDDHALFRRGVASLLQNEGFHVVGEARDGAEAVEQAKKLRPDVVLMDVYMPGVNGLEATRRITEAVPSAKVVILTVSEKDENLFEAVKGGAHGYLLKSAEPEALFQTVRGVARGETFLSPTMATKILQEFARLGQGAPERAPSARLSPREREVLELLTRGTTNKEIASALDISENTVKNHLKSIMEKLHLENRVQVAAYALREGLVKRQETS